MLAVQTRQKLKLLATFSVAFVACGKPPTRSVEGLLPLELERYRGDTCRSYPKLSFIERIGEVNVFWSAGPNCQTPSVVVNQEQTLEGGRALAKSINDGLANFLLLANKATPQWQEIIDEKILPLDLILVPATQGGAWAAGVDDLVVDQKDGNAIELQHRRIIAAAPILTAQDIKAGETVVMHEVAHCISGGLDRFSNGQFLEETWADIVGNGTANFSPYFGEGYGKARTQRYTTLLKRTDLSEQERALYEARLSAASTLAYRDFTQRKTYPEAYAVPEPHIVSSYINHAVYRLWQVIDPESLLIQFLRVYVDKPGVLRSGDLSELLFAATEPWKDKPDVQNVLNDLGWQRAVEAPGQLNLSWRRADGGTEQHLLRVSANETLSPQLSDTAFSEPNLTLYRSDEPIRAYQQVDVYGDTVYSDKAYRLAMTATENPCSDTDEYCVCIPEWDRLKLSGTYRSIDGGVQSTARQPLPALETAKSNCYEITVEEVAR